MNTREQFIEGINANPANMELRLVYADWLEERGDKTAQGWRWLATNGKVPAPVELLRDDAMEVDDTYIARWVWMAPNDLWLFESDPECLPDDNIASMSCDCCSSPFVALEAAAAAVTHT